MAEVYDVRVAPHNPNGPVGTAASVHASAVMPNFHILEYAISPTRDACQAAVTEGDVFRARNGRIELPTKPGLGIDLDEEYLRAHPFITGELGAQAGGNTIVGAFELDGGVSNV
jgi:galactonate dehydratase